MFKRFDTAGITPRERLSYWNDLASRSIAPMLIEPHSPDTFDASFRHLHLNRCEMYSVDSTAASITSAGASRARQAAATDGVKTPRLNLVVQNAGISHTVTDGVPLLFRPGDFAILDPFTTYEINFEERTDVLVISISSGANLERFRAIEQFTGVHKSADHGAAAILSDFIRSAWRNIERDKAGDWAFTFAQVIWPLIERVYDTRIPRDSMALDEDRRKHVRTFVEENIANPDLNARLIASTLGVSPRYVQVLFAELGHTPSEYIRERRLALAAERLALGGRSTSVTEVALSLGFNELSHFARAFKQRFGLPPNEYRQADLREAAQPPY
jgi:AraC-like DNA-binding protein